MAWRSGRLSTSRARLLLATLSLMFLSVLAWLVANMHFIREQRQVGTILVLLSVLVAVIASAGPVQGATRIDPALVLREE